VYLYAVSDCFDKLFDFYDNLSDRFDKYLKETKIQ
jgi:site-specific DNA-adenine methylase